MENETYRLRHDPQRCSYEFVLDDGSVAEITYRRQGDVLLIDHTGVPPAFENRGIGRRLVEAVLCDVRDHGWKVVPQCPFVAAFIRRHPVWREVVCEEAGVD